MSQTISKHLGEGFGKGELYAALAYDENDAFGGMKIKRICIAASRLDVTTGYERYLKIEGTLDSTGSAGGVKTRGLDIELERATATVVNGDSRDQALKISIVDEVGGHTTGYFIRAIDAQAKYDATGQTLTALYGGNVTAYIKNGTVTDSYAFRIGMKCDGVVTNDFVGIQIQSESQGSISGDDIGLQFTTSAINPATGAVTYCIEVAPANTSGFDAFLHFTDGDKSDGSYTSLVCNTDGVDSDAGIKVVIGTTDYYIPLFADANVTGEW